MAQYNMYLDDLRNPHTTKEWAIVRSYQEAVNMIVEFGMPTYISFDHDLGEDVPTGFDLAKWMVNEHLDGVTDWPANFEFNVHSANPVGAANIQKLLDGYIGHMSI